MHSVVKIFGALFALLFISGCGPSEAVIKGNVFVATKGGVNYKLALINVKVISENSFKNVITSTTTQKKEEMRSGANKISNLISAHYSSADAYNIKLNNYIKDKDKLEESLQHPPLDVYYRFATSYNSATMTFFINARYTDGANNAYKYDMNDPVLTKYLESIENQKTDLVKQFALLLELHKELLISMDEININLSRYNKDCSIETVANKIWAKLKSDSVASTVSDADGNFSILVPIVKESKFVVFADGKRRLIDADENYKWLRKVDVEAPNQRDTVILLSNNEIASDEEVVGFNEYKFRPIEFKKNNAPRPVPLVLKISKYN